MFLDEVSGTSLSDKPHADFEVVRLDVTDRKRMLDAIKDVAPDEVYHLAALRQPTLPDERAYFEVNLHGTLHVLVAASGGQPCAGGEQRLRLRRALGPDRRGHADATHRRHAEPR